VYLVSCGHKSAIAAAVCVCVCVCVCVYLLAFSRAVNETGNINDEFFLFCPTETRTLLYGLVET
jgi:hypothetical protein